MMTYLRLLQEFKAGLTLGRPNIGEEKETQSDEWETDYYSSQESETNHMTDKEDESGEEDQQDWYITRSGRTSKPPMRLTYDAQACLLTPDDHEDQESWSEQHLLA